MVKLKIPEKHLEGVAAILVLHDIQAASLASELDEDTGHKDGRSFAKAHTISGLEASRTAKIYDTLKELYKVREAEHLSVPEFVEALIRAMNTSGIETLVVSDENQAAVSKMLLRLLGARGFGIEAKVNALRKDAERQFCAAKVITDVRPVFGDALSAGPVRMLVMNTLRFGFHDYSKHHDIYVSLTDGDIARLIDTLQRAQAKSQLLAKRFIRGTDEPSK